MAKPRHWSSPDGSCFWQRIWKESDNSASVPDENISRDNFTFQGLHQEDDSCPPDESTRSSSSLYSVLKQCNNDFISSTMKILLQMSMSDKKTQDDLLKDWIARTLDSTKRGGYLDLTDMLEVFYQLTNHVTLILAALDKSFGHLDISGILPTNLYYFLESEDERKNPSWKRRMHRFHSRINVNQIFHLNDMLYLSKISYAGSIEEIKEGCNAASEPMELIFCDLESRPNRPSHFIAVKKNQSLLSRDLEVVLVIRGTSTIMDVMTDCLIEAVPYRGGKAHRGILESGRYIVNEHRNLLNELRNLSGKWNIKLTLVGHSLGAGVASIAGIEFSHLKNFKVRVIGFGCPSILSPDLAKKYENIITTVIADSDIVPRMSAATVANVLLDIMEFDWSEFARRDIIHAMNEAKQSNPFLLSDDVLKSVNTAIDSSLQDYVSGCISVPTSVKMQPELCPPGTCVHLYRDGSGITGVIAPGDFFQEIDVTREMITDHMISTGYEKVLLELVRQHRNDLHFRFEDSK